MRASRFAAGEMTSPPGGLVAVAAVITYDARPETEYARRRFEDIVRERPHNGTALGTAVDELLRLPGTR
jgi:hypothetical protein